MSEGPDPVPGDVDGRGWRAHGTWPPPPASAPDPRDAAPPPEASPPPSRPPAPRPPPRFPSAPAPPSSGDVLPPSVPPHPATYRSSPRRPGSPTSSAGVRTVVVAAFVAVLVIAGIGMLTSTGTDAGAPSPTTFAPSDTAGPVALDRLFVSAPPGYVAAPPTSGITSQELTDAAGSVGDVVSTGLVRDGYVTGARQVAASADGRDHVTVSIYQLASPGGAADFVPHTLQPYLVRGPWAFGGPAPAGGVGLQRVVPDAAGTYGLVAAASSGRFVVVVETSSPDQPSTEAVLTSTLLRELDALPG